MKWKRVNPGHYESGVFTITREESHRVGLAKQTDWTLRKGGREIAKCRTLYEAKQWAERTPSKI